MEFERDIDGEFNGYMGSLKKKKWEFSHFGRGALIFDILIFFVCDFDL